MKKFESIIMSESEPLHTSLWLRQALTPSKEDGKVVIRPMGFNLWWFSPQGWKPLSDFDTRYEVENNYLPDASSKPLDTETSYDYKIGVMSVVNTHFIYDASRVLGNNKNLVEETGLKHHVDDLQGQINSLKSRVSVLENKVSSLESTVAQQSNTISSLASRISALEERP